MFQLGIDMGSSTVKRALLEDDALRRSWLAAHQGELTQTLRRVRQDRHHRRGADVQFLIPYGYVADAGGQYARAVCTVLDRSGYRDTAIAAPILEELPQHAADPDLLLRAVLTGDVLYAALADMRAQLAPQAIPTWEELTRLAAQISALPHGRNRLAAVGSPLCVTSLNEGILDTLEREGYQIARIPLGEMLWVLWRDNGTAAPE